MTVRIVLQRGIGALLLGLLLAGCGGGDQVNSFRPQRLLVFGDEASVITSDGRKFTVNALDPLDTTTADPDDRTDLQPLGSAFNCGANRIWIQILAAQYGFSFDACNPVTGDTPQRGQIYAQAGSRIADLPAQIATHGSFTNRDLVTVFTGQQDIIDLYATASSAGDCRYESADSAGPVARAARALGAQLKQRVDGIAANGSGGRVLFVTVPNVGATPFGRAERAANTDFDRAVCLANLTNAFNAGLRATGLQDGRLIGLIAIDDQLEVIIDNDDVFGFSNVTDAACTVALPDCTSATLVAGATSTNYLWADARRFGPEFHERLGLIAVSRALNNPF